jgi:AcrR family transcriptional regulator
MKTDRSAVDKSSVAGRPRDPRIDAAILQATAELLVEIGYANLTLAAVAERAGTTKTALYRRWASKAELVHEAAFPASVPVGVTASGGAIADDIRDMLSAARYVFSSPVVRAAIPGLIADMSADVALSARIQSRFIGVFEAVQKRLADAVSSGEVHSDVNPERLIELVGGAALIRILSLPGVELDEAWVEQTAAIIIHGVALGGSAQESSGSVGEVE